jgi:hypothetical protein
VANRIEATQQLALDGLLSEGEREGVQQGFSMDHLCVEIQRQLDETRAALDAAQAYLFAVLGLPSASTH